MQNTYPLTKKETGINPIKMDYEVINYLIETTTYKTTLLPKGCMKKEEIIKIFFNPLTDSQM
ncbi:MAG: hypothetical protein EA412_00400 [Chitinophagaceae bacterium]|nr:MAG: hypothetical protein EA412_00400 [Chitinophagaceae bacterium]